MKTLKKWLNAPVGKLVFFVLACTLDGSHTPSQKWEWIVEDKASDWLRE